MSGYICAHLIIGFEQHLILTVADQTATAQHCMLFLYRHIESLQYRQVSQRDLARFQSLIIHGRRWEAQSPWHPFSMALPGS